jgi:hypothetical protein
MTIERNTNNDAEIKKAWDALWELASNFINWGEGTIDHDGFIEFGEKQFEIKVKEDFKE